MNTIIKPNIYEYNDFRKFIDDFYIQNKEAGNSLSKAGLCRSLGLPNSRSYFGEVIQGRFVSSNKM